MTRWISPVMTSTEVTLLPHYSSWGRETAFFTSTSSLPREMQSTPVKLSKTIHIYACKIRERLTKELRENALPFTVIADEITDPLANQEILSVCLRFVDLSSPQDPHIRECLVSLLYTWRERMPEQYPKRC